MIGVKEVAAISLRAPLLFIDGPPMVTVVHAEKEESTTIYWKPDEETAPEQQTPQSDPPALQQEPDVIRKIRYLSEPFPRRAYRPLQFLVGGQLLTGDIVALSGTEIAVQVTEESQALEEIRTIDLQAIEEVFWKGQPFR